MGVRSKTASLTDEEQFTVLKRFYRLEQSEQKTRQFNELPGPYAEDRGFEPLRALTQHAFQACAIGR